MAISRGEIKWVRALHSKKGRKEFKCFLAEGKKCVNEALRSRLTVHKIYSCNPSELETDVAQQITEKEMEQITALATASPHLVVIEIPASDTSFSINERVVVLDQISDPGNAGTMIRTADWFGIRNVVMMENSVEWTSTKVVQASMGSVFRMNIVQFTEEDLKSFLSTKNGLVMGADLIGTPMDSAAWSEVNTLIIGSESHGISTQLKTYCNGFVTINGHGSAESLNAAVAAGILMSHWKP